MLLSLFNHWNGSGHSFRVYYLLVYRAFLPVLTEESKEDWLDIVNISFYILWKRIFTIVFYSMIILHVSHSFCLEKLFCFGNIFLNYANLSAIKLSAVHIFQTQRYIVKSSASNDTASHSAAPLHTYTDL